MADKTIPQTATIGLPAKHYYTLQEVADRWTRMTGQAVNVDDVLHYEENLSLRLSAYLSCLDGISIRQVSESGKEERTLPFGYEGIIFPVSLGISICSQVVRSKSFSFLSLWIIDSPPFVNACFYTCDINGNTKKAVLSVDSLRITRQELHRFEEAHGIGKPAQLGQLQDMNEETKVKRLERALGALALGLAKDATKYRNGDGANISAIAATALKSIRQNEDDSRPRGYGETIIYNAISEAVKAVQKDRVSR